MAYVTVTSQILEPDNDAKCGKFNCVYNSNLSQTDPIAIVMNVCALEPKIAFNFAWYDRYDPDSRTSEDDDFYYASEICVTHTLVSMVKLRLLEHKFDYNTTCIG